MRTTVLAAVAAAALAAAPAGADGNGPHVRVNLTGACRVQATYDGAAWGVDTRITYVARESDGITPRLVPVFVECVLFVGGSPFGIDVGTASGTAVAAGSRATSLTGEEDDALLVCAYTTAGNDTGTDCRDLVPLGETYVDPVVCPWLAGQSGGLADQPPLVDLRDDGDLWVGSTPVWTCPPYSG